MRHPENTRYAKRNRLNALDAASRCGMTVTDRLASGRMYTWNVMAKAKGYAVIAYTRTAEDPKIRQNALRKAVNGTLKGRLLEAKRRPFANLLAVRQLARVRRGGSRQPSEGLDTHGFTVLLFTVLPFYSFTVLPFLTFSPSHLLTFTSPLSPSPRRASQLECRAPERRRG